MLSYCSLISIHGEKQSEDAPEVIVEERIKSPRDAAVHLREYLKINSHSAVLAPDSQAQPTSAPQALGCFRILCRHFGKSYLTVKDIGSVISSQLKHFILEGERLLK